MGMTAGEKSEDQTAESSGQQIKEFDGKVAK
jgi:hypothetical protein